MDMLFYNITMSWAHLRMAFNSPDNWLGFPPTLVSEGHPSLMEHGPAVSDFGGEQAPWQGSML